MQLYDGLDVVERLVLQDIEDGAEPLLRCEATLQRLFALGLTRSEDGKWMIMPQGRVVGRTAAGP